MLLQGNLQMVFDALYNLGVIDPVLKQDWVEAMDELPAHSQQLEQIVQVANQYQSDAETLQAELERFDDQALSYLAMEVARELAGFHTRQAVH